MFTKKFWISRNNGYCCHPLGSRLNFLNQKNRKWSPQPHFECYRQKFNQKDLSLSTMTRRVNHLKPQKSPMHSIPFPLIWTAKRLINFKHHKILRRNFNFHLLLSKYSLCSDWHFNNIINSSAIRSIIV